MREPEPVNLHSNEAFRVEMRGFDHIPEPERNMTLPQVAAVWVGNSVNLFGFAMGALAIVQGLSLPAALAACVVGFPVSALVYTALKAYSVRRAQSPMLVAE